MNELPPVLDKDGKEIEFPYTLKKGSVSVKIYRTPTRGCDSYTLSYWQDSKRKRPTFNTFDKALDEAKTVARRLGSASGDVLTLTSADRATFLRLKELEVQIGIPLEVIVSDRLAVQRILGNTPPIVAAQYYAKQHRTDQPLILVKEVVDEMINAKRGDGLSDGYLKHLRYDLDKFNERFGTHISAVTGGEIDAWLRELEVSARTRNNLRCSVHTLFNYAKSRKYLAKDHDELESVARAKQHDGEIEVFTPAEIIEILVHATEEMIPFLAIGAFAGIRHAEVQKLHWEDIRLDDDVIEVRAKKAKTASRRTVPITPNLKLWLTECRKDTGPVCGYTNIGFALHKITKGINVARRWARIQAGGKTVEKAALSTKERKRQKGDVPPGAETAEAEGWTAFAWKHNALRHSFISYRVADIQNMAQVSLEAGNSPQMINRHYKELVRAKDAKAWFGITPAMVDERREALRQAEAEAIVPVPTAAAA